VLVSAFIIIIGIDKVISVLHALFYRRNSFHVSCTSLSHTAAYYRRSQQDD